MHSNFEITKPLDNKITQKLVDEQNSVCKQIEDDTKPIKIIRGVPGTGKSVIIIARMLRTKNTAIFVKDTEQLSNFFTENQRLRWTSNPNDTTLAPFVGKGSTDPVMCPERKLQYPNKVKIPISAHKFCDGYKKNCPFYNEIYEDTPNGRKVKDRATEKISRLLKDINSYYPNHESMQLKDVVNFIASWGYCPYYFFREMVKIADNVLCDYYHFIQPQVIKSLGPFHNASIDEDLIFDSLTKYMSAKIETDEIEKSLKKLEKKEILFYNEISIPMLHKTINFLKRKGEIVRKLKEKAEEINLKQEIASDKEGSKKYGCEFWMDQAETCPYENIGDCYYGNLKIKRELAKEYKIFKWGEKTNKETKETYPVKTGVVFPNLAELIINEFDYHFVTTTDTKEIYYYNGGIYHSQGENIIRNISEEYMEQLSSKHGKNEIEDHIRDKNYKPRTIFNTP